MNIDKFLEMCKKTSAIYSNFYEENVLFSLNWWFLLVLLIAPWFVWYKLVDKSKFLLLLLQGCFITILDIFLDDIGSGAMLWVYPYRLIHIIPRLNSIDISVLPVAYMLMYQYAPKWKNFIIAQTVFSLIASFIGEPIFISLGIYKPISWEHIYSFPIYILIGIIAKWFSDNLDKKIRLLNTQKSGEH